MREADHTPKDGADDCPDAPHEQAEATAQRGKLSAGQQNLVSVLENLEALRSEASRMALTEQRERARYSLCREADERDLQGRGARAASPGCAMLSAGHRTAGDRPDGSRPPAEEARGGPWGQGAASKPRTCMGLAMPSARQVPVSVCRELPTSW